MAIVNPRGQFTQCADGSLSDAKRSPCKTRGGAKGVVEGLCEKLVNKLNIEDVPVDDVYTRKDVFQNRDTDYSSDSVARIIAAVEDGKFDWVQFDPIILWLDPSDKRLYVLSGHSRTEAFVQLSEMGRKEFEKIPAKIFRGTFEEARMIALNSNVLSTPETLSERAKYYQRETLAGRIDTKQALALIKRYEANNSSLVTAYYFLNPRGMAMTAVRALEGRDGTSEQGAIKMALWIGSVRQSLQELTNRHEDELFDYLVHQKQITTLVEFKERIKKAVEKLTFFGNFDAEKPLNLYSNIARSSVEIAWDNRKFELMKVITDLEKQAQTFRQRLNQEGASTQAITTNPAVKNIEAQLSVARAKFAQHMATKDDVHNANRAQTDLFMSGIGSTSPVSIAAPLIGLGVAFFGFQQKNTPVIIGGILAAAFPLLSKAKDFIMQFSWTKAQKFEYLAPFTKDAQKGTGLFPSVTLAQWALETGYGRSTIGSANNLFGIKSGSSWRGKVISMTTSEVISGQRVTYKGTNKTYTNRAAAIADGANSETLFRSYPSPKESIMDRVRLLSTSRYVNAGVTTAATAEDQARAIKAAGYATDPQYSQKLISIITANDLTKYD